MFDCVNGECWSDFVYSNKITDVISIRRVEAVYDCTLTLKRELIFYLKTDQQIRQHFKNLFFISVLSSFLSMRYRYPLFQSLKKNSQIFPKIFKGHFDFYKNVTHKITAPKSLLLINACRKWW